MCASQVTHTSTEICNWSTDPSVRNNLTIEVRTDTSCTDELLGSSSGDFKIWISTQEVPYAFQRWRNKLFASDSITGWLLHPSGGQSWLDRKGWEAAKLSLPKGVPPTPDSNQSPSKSCRLIRCATAAALLKSYVIGNRSEAELLLIVWKIVGSSPC